MRILRFRPGLPRPAQDSFTPIPRSGRSRQTTRSPRKPKTHQSDFGFWILDWSLALAFRLSALGFGLRFQISNFRFQIGLGFVFWSQVLVLRFRISNLKLSSPT